MTTAHRTSSGKSMHTCCTIADPKDNPTSATGGSQTPRISSAASRAKSSIGHGSGCSQVVAPMPRLSNVVLRKALSK